MATLSWAATLGEGAMRTLCAACTHHMVVGEHGFTNKEVVYCSTLRHSCAHVPSLTHARASAPILASHPFSTSRRLAFPFFPFLPLTLPAGWAAMMALSTHKIVNSTPAADATRASRSAEGPTTVTSTSSSPACSAARDIHDSSRQ